MLNGLGDDACELLTKAPLTPASALRSSRVIPDAGGIYAFWFSDIPPLVSATGTLNRDGHRLLYVGIAPKAPSRAGKVSSSTLRTRLRTHVRGRIARSTLRRTLASLLADDLGLTLRLNHKQKPVMTDQHEAALTHWIAACSRVTWHVMPEAWKLEDALVSSGPRLPLNIKGSSDAFASELQSLRAIRLMRPPSRTPTSP